MASEKKVKYENATDETRIWPDIIVDGHTLELEPWEVVELELPEDFSDPNLKKVGEKEKVTKDTKPPETPPETPNSDSESEVK